MTKYKLYIYIYINSPIVGFEVIIQGFEDGEPVDDDPYFLEVRNYPTVDFKLYDLDLSVEAAHVYFTGFVATLLEGVEGIRIGYEDIPYKGYIAIERTLEDPEPPDVILENEKMKNKYPFFHCHLPFHSEKTIEEVSQIVSKQLFGGLPFKVLENEDHLTMQLDQPILGLVARVIQEDEGEKRYLLKIENDPSLIPAGVEPVKIDITRFISLSLEEGEGIDIDYPSINKEFVKIG